MTPDDDPVPTDVTVPGAPLTLRTDRLEGDDSGARLSWSYVDPTGEVDRLHGATTTTVTRPSDVWRVAQLDAACHLRLHLDLDTRPGEPYVASRYEVDEAWQLLLDHLSRTGRVVETSDALTVVGIDDRQRGSIRVTRASWATYLNQFAEPAGAVDDDALWVPTAVPVVDGLPLWADDDLTHSVGAWGDVRVEGTEIVRVHPPGPRTTP